MIRPSYRRRRNALLGVLGAALAVAGCGGGDSSTATTLGEGRTAQDVAQCMKAHGWEDYARAYGAQGVAWTVADPTDGTTIVISDADVDTASKPGPYDLSFRINNESSSIEIEIAGAGITDEEKDQVYYCASGAQPVVED